MVDHPRLNTLPAHEGVKLPSPRVSYLETLQHSKKSDEALLSEITREVQGVLGQLQHIAELIGMHKNIAPVEDIQQKIKAAYQKIKALLNPELIANPGLEKGGPDSGINLAQNPLIKDMGGMPLEVISREWQEALPDTLLDKAELENLVNKKLKSRLELANKLKANQRLSLQAKPKPSKPMLPKFKKLQETLKYIIKEMPKPEAPRPAQPLPRPRPPGT